MSQRQLNAYWNMTAQIK